MPSIMSCRSTHNERHTRSAVLCPSWPVVATICLLIAALVLVGCSSSGAPQQIQAAPVVTPEATASVSQPTAAKTSSALGGQFTLLTATDGGVIVPAVGLSDGKARFYSIRNGDKVVPFFVVQGSDGVVRAALDACDVCFESKLGFRQEGDAMVCNACGNRYLVNAINLDKGGCNPVSLDAVLQGNQVSIQFADLQAGARYF